MFVKMPFAAGKHKVSKPVQPGRSVDKPKSVVTAKDYDNIDGNEHYSFHLVIQECNFLKVIW